MRDFNSSLYDSQFWISIYCSRWGGTVENLESGHAFARRRLGFVWSQFFGFCPVVTTRERHVGSAASFGQRVVLCTGFFGQL